MAERVFIKVPVAQPHIRLARAGETENPLDAAAMAAAGRLMQAVLTALEQGYRVAAFAYGVGAGPWVRLVGSSWLDDRVARGQAFDEGQGRDENGVLYRNGYYMEGDVKVYWTSRGEK